MTDVLRRGRASLAFSFFAQGVAFALLVTRIPAVQDRYGVSDALLPVFLAAVPVLAGVGSVTTERLVRRIPPSALLRWSQPVVLLALLAVGAGRGMAGLAVALAAFGLAVGALDASMNMLGVSLQRSYGRSIMLSFHAVYSLGGILGASLAWAGGRTGIWRCGCRICRSWRCCCRRRCSGAGGTSTGTARGGRGRLGGQGGGVGGGCPGAGPWCSGCCCRCVW
ncbi:hypothetical protein GCM10020256_32320 [Streptomyces thermocoprophilus]